MTQQEPAPTSPALPRAWLPRQEWVKTQPQALVASCVLLRDEHSRLLMLRYSSTEPGSGKWWLPGGMLDHGEDPLAAVRRETYEETGITLRGTPTLIGYDHRADVGGTGPVVDFYWNGGTVADPIHLSGEHDRYAFFDLNDLKAVPLSADTQTLAELCEAAETGAVVCLREGRLAGSAYSPF
ncbi:NUDIX hydrolase [Streptomyces sp. NPDC002476]|uniref:NUDIX hydrolase n=1 Tax=Streptomyces sp. NPDC002476 TaxID=3364648 RepID=UPI0036BA284B